MNKAVIIKSMLYGLMGMVALLGMYFGTISIISGWTFAIDQFTQFWYFVVTLAIGFGIQIGLYTYLKKIVHQSSSSGKVLAVSGATSVGTMVSCCAHYLVNILPILGVTGFVSILSQYQVGFFWIGIAFNIAGIVYIGRKIIIFNKQAKQT